MPFATIVTQDYDGWDTASDLTARACSG